MNTEFFHRYLYYGLIFILSLIMLCFLPMVGSEVGMDWDIPDTTIGWIVWGVTNLTSAFFNVMLFHFFIKQGKQNILNDERYIAANELLARNKIKKIAKPLSPKQWHGRQYSKKGVMIFLFTVIGTISFSQAILTWNLTKFLAQIVTLASGVVFGAMQMKTTEEYWTIEYPEYAAMKVAQAEAEQTDEPCADSNFSNNSNKQEE